MAMSQCQARLTAKATKAQLPKSFKANNNNNNNTDDKFLNWSEKLEILNITAPAGGSCTTCPLPKGRCGQYYCHDDAIWSEDPEQSLARQLGKKILILLGVCIAMVFADNMAMEFFQDSSYELSLIHI